MSDFSENLKSAIERAGMTQRQLADKINVTEVTISRYVQGTRIPKATMISKMAKVLNMPINSLLGAGEDEAEPEETYRLSMWVCLDETLKNYGVRLDLTPTIWEHLVNDFMAMLVKQGYAERKEDAEN